MKRWLKLVGLLLFAVIAVAVISPDFDLEPTVAHIARIAQKPPVVAFTVPTPVAIDFRLQNSRLSRVRFSFSSYHDNRANLIDLNCTRLC